MKITKSELKNMIRGLVEEAVNVEPNYNKAAKDLEDLATKVNETWEKNNAKLLDKYEAVPDKPVRDKKYAMQLVTAEEATKNVSLAIIDIAQEFNIAMQGINKLKPTLDEKHKTQDWIGFVETYREIRTEITSAGIKDIRAKYMKPAIKKGRGYKLTTPTRNILMNGFGMLDSMKKEYDKALRKAETLKNKVAVADNKASAGDGFIVGDGLNNTNIPKIVKGMIQGLDALGISASQNDTIAKKKAAGPGGIPHVDFELVINGKTWECTYEQNAHGNGARIRIFENSYTDVTMFGSYDGYSSNKGKLLSDVIESQFELENIK
jgi:hypothetical protein